MYSCLQNSFLEKKIARKYLKTITAKCSANTENAKLNIFEVRPLI